MLRRSFASAAGGRTPADPSVLHVSYLDRTSVRRRLINVAQLARAALAEEGRCSHAIEPLPQLQLPESERAGHWFMRFERESHVLVARRSLDGHHLTSACGTLRGRLLLGEKKKASK